MNRTDITAPGERKNTLQNKGKEEEMGFENVVGGKLKLKGAAIEKPDKKKKKKKKKKKDKKRD